MKRPRCFLGRSVALAMLAGGLSGAMLVAGRDDGRTAALRDVGRELAAAEYLQRSALDGDAVALRYLPDSRRRLCAALLATTPHRIDCREPVPFPFGDPVRLRDAYDALPRLRAAGRTPTRGGGDLAHRNGSLEGTLRRP